MLFLYSVFVCSKSCMVFFANVLLWVVFEVANAMVQYVSCDEIKDAMFNVGENNRLLRMALPRLSLKIVGRLLGKMYVKQFKISLHIAFF